MDRKQQQLLTFFVLSSIINNINAMPAKHIAISFWEVP